MPNEPRIYTQGYLLYEYVHDENRYVIVGVVDSVGRFINEETDKAEDCEEAELFVSQGIVRFRVYENEQLSFPL